MISKSGLMTPLAKAKGFGSAKEGAHHWWVQRLTAIINIPLVIWFVWSVTSMMAALDVSSSETILEGYALARAWVAVPLNAILLGALILNLCLHVKLGVQVVIEDYVHCKFKKYFALILMNLLVLAVAGVSVFSILQVSFGG